MGVCLYSISDNFIAQQITKRKLTVYRLKNRIMYTLLFCALDPDLYILSGHYYQMILVYQSYIVIGVEVGRAVNNSIF